MKHNQCLSYCTPFFYGMAYYKPFGKKKKIIRMKIAPPTGQIKYWTHTLNMKILQSPNIGMWGVYPEAMDWNVGAVCSDFNLGERIWR